MDCDDVTLLIAASSQRTLTGVEETQFRSHVEDCSDCQTLVAEHDTEQWRWLARVHVDALDGDDLEELVTVDPIAFVPLGTIATGGMGRIVRAHDRRLGREVAVKELLDKHLQARFEREARITARLQHRAIVSVYEAGQFPDGTCFYTMPLLSRKTLHDAITSAKTLPERLMLLPYVRTVVDAVAYAHANGIIHRDLKPNNILVGEFGEAMVIDWGLAKDLNAGDDDDPGENARSDNAELTRTGAVMGTPCYMSPEQAEGKASTMRDDVYALGAIMYTLLAGAPPYWDTSEHDSESLVTATRQAPPSSLAALAADAPKDLRAIVERAMSRKAEDRFATAKELADELARFEAGQLLMSREYTVRELVARWIRRHRRLAGLIAVGVVASVSLLVLWFRYENERRLRERGARTAAVYRDVARQAYLISRDLFRLESALEGLATASAWALTGPEPPPPEKKIYFTQDFATKPPSDFTKETAYRWPVSLDTPVASVAPGVDSAALAPKIRRLAPIGDHIRQMVLEAAVGETTTLPPAEALAVLRDRKGPIDYAYVDLQEGVHFVWPGMASLRHDYDVRTSSFYLKGVDKRGPQWGSPYVDSTTDERGDDLVLPCTTGIWSPWTGEFLGVAGVEMTVTKLLTTSMHLPTRKTLRVSLVDEHGRRVLDTRHANQRFPTSGRDEAIQLEEFDVPEVAAAIRAKVEGVRNIVRDGRAVLVAFVRLDAPHWYFVVEVDADTLGE